MINTRIVVLKTVLVTWILCVFTFYLTLNINLLGADEIKEKTREKEKSKNEIVITVKGIKVIEGSIKIAIYNDERSFPKSGREYLTFSVPVTSKTVSCKIKNLPEGIYAIALYQDINGNNICDKNLFGIPVEPFGFSNNARVKLSPPKFSECSFDTVKTKMIVIKMIEK